jgi:hypothetical protein
MPAREEFENCVDVQIGQYAPQTAQKPLSPIMSKQPVKTNSKATPNRKVKPQVEISAAKKRSSTYISKQPIKLPPEEVKNKKPKELQNQKPKAYPQKLIPLTDSTYPVLLADGAVPASMYLCSIIAFFVFFL